MGECNLFASFEPRDLTRPVLSHFCWLRYVPSVGTDAAREIIAERYSVDGCPVHKEDVWLSGGGGSGIYLHVSFVTVWLRVSLWDWKNLKVTKFGLCTICWKCEAVWFSIVKWWLSCMDLVKLLWVPCMVSNRDILWSVFEITNASAINVSQHFLSQSSQQIVQFQWSFTNCGKQCTFSTLSKWCWGEDHTALAGERLLLMGGGTIRETSSKLMIL